MKTPILLAIFLLTGCGLNDDVSTLNDEPGAGQSVRHWAAEVTYGSGTIADLELTECPNSSGKLVYFRSSASPRNQKPTHFAPDQGLLECETADGKIAQCAPNRKALVASIHLEDDQLRQIAYDGVDQTFAPPIDAQHVAVSTYAGVLSRVCPDFAATSAPSQDAKPLADLKQRTAALFTDARTASGDLLIDVMKNFQTVDDAKLADAKTYLLRFLLDAGFTVVRDYAPHQIAVGFNHVGYIRVESKVAGLPRFNVLIWRDRVEVQGFDGEAKLAAAMKKFTADFRRGEESLAELIKVVNSIVPTTLRESDYEYNDRSVTADYVSLRSTIERNSTELDVQILANGYFSGQFAIADAISEDSQRVYKRGNIKVELNFRGASFDGGKLVLNDGYQGSALGAVLGGPSGAPLALTGYGNQHPILGYSAKCACNFYATDLDGFEVYVIMEESSMVHKIEKFGSRKNLITTLGESIPLSN